MVHQKFELAPEMVLLLGWVKIWDPRQNTPVISLEPADKDAVFPDWWAVSFFK